MAIDWAKLSALSDEAGDLLQVVKPYLPALARAGQGVFDGFIQHLNDKDWTSIDALMYAHMTPDERKELEDQVLAGVRAAAQDKFERVQLTKDIAMKMAISLLTKLI